MYCIESLPRLKSVQLSFHTSYDQLSLSNQSLIAPISKEEVDLKLKSSLLDLASPPHISIAKNIVSLKLGSKPWSPHVGISPPVDVLGGDHATTYPAEVELACCFCKSTITSRDK